MKQSNSVYGLSTTKTGRRTQSRMYVFIHTCSGPGLNLSLVGASLSEPDTSNTNWIFSVYMYVCIYIMSLYSHLIVVLRAIGKKLCALKLN